MSSQSPAQIVLEAVSEFKATHTARLDELEKKINRGAIFGGGGDPGDRGLTEARKALGTFARSGVIEAQNSMSVGSNPDGGYTVRPELDARILEIQRNLSPMRQIAQTVKTTSGKWQRPVNLQGTGTGWVGETSARPGTASPQLTLVEIETGEIFTNPAITQTLLDDSEVAVGDFLVGEIAREFDVKEGSAFLLSRFQRGGQRMLSVIPSHSLVRDADHGGQIPCCRKRRAAA
jgi:HK97 family phage major capsid protein